MPQRDGNTVAVERRMDLASLFCMIGRHGPAVALAVIAMVSVLAGFIIYRSVRGKRSKAAAAAAAAADGDGKSPGAEGDESAARPGLEPSPEEPHESESTDVGEEGLAEMKEAADLFHSDLNIRHRHAAAAAAAAAEKKLSPYSPPESEMQIPDYKHTTSDDTEEMTVAQDTQREAERYAEETSHNQQCDTDTVAAVEVEGAGDCHWGATDDTVKDVIDEVREIDSCWKEPELINNESHEEEQMFKEEYQEDECVITDKDVPDEKEEESVQHFSDNQVCFDQAPHMRENVDEDVPQENKTTSETNGVHSDLEEQDVHTEDIHTENEEFEEGNPHLDCTDPSSHLSAEEEKKNVDEEAEEECVDQQQIPKQDEALSTTSEQDPNPLPSQQDQCDYMTDNLMLSLQESDCNDGGGFAGEVTEEDTDKDHVLTVAECDAHTPQSDNLQIEQKDENSLTCNEEAAETKEKTLASNGTVACGEECNDSSPVPSPTLHCSYEPIKVDNRDDDLSSINTDAKAELSLECQQQPSEVTDEEEAPHLTTDTDLTNSDLEMTSLEKEIQFETNETGPIIVMAEESINVLPCCNDQQTGQMVNNEAFDKTRVTAAAGAVTCDAENITAPIMAENISDPPVASSYKDQESVQMINYEDCDESRVAADPDPIENVPAYITAEEMSCPSIFQDQKFDHVEINETAEKMEVVPATDSAASDNANIITSEMSEEISRPDTLSFSKDQQNDRTQNNEDFFEFTTSAAPVRTGDVNPPLCHIHLLSFQQNDLTDNDKDSMSSPGVREESGISSMTVSPDVQDAGNEFGMTTEDMVPPVINCDPQSEERAEAQNTSFADDIAILVINEDTTGMVFEPYPSRLSPQPHCEHTDWAKYESFAANEDMFGYEIEDSYHREMEQLVAQIAATTMSLTDELKKQTDVKAVVEVVEIKEKKEGVTVAKKVETDEDEKEEDYEKTEISIMEATMDNNEWITDNYVLPWTNLSSPSFAQDHTKANQLPTQECEHSSPATDAGCVDPDIPPSTEVKETSTLSLVDENVEHNKKVVAVQPMPQSVNVTFRIHYLTHSPYQTVAITGNQQELGNWKDFIPLERAKDGHWATVVSLPAESHVEWKFVVVDKGEVCRWEECGNRLLDTGYGDDLIVHKWWGLL